MHARYKEPLARAQDPEGVGLPHIPVKSCTEMFSVLYVHVILLFLKNELVDKLILLGFYFTQCFILDAIPF